VRRIGAAWHDVTVAVKQQCSIPRGRHLNEVCCAVG
jgi:hypothetical protein